MREADVRRGHFMLWDRALFGSNINQRRKRWNSTNLVFLPVPLLLNDWVLKSKVCRVWRPEGICVHLTCSQSTMISAQPFSHKECMTWIRYWNTARVEVSTNKDFVVIAHNTVRDWIFFSTERWCQIKNGLYFSQNTLSVWRSVCVVFSDMQLWHVEIHIFGVLMQVSLCSVWPVYEVILWQLKSCHMTVHCHVG